MVLRISYSWTFKLKILLWTAFNNLIVTSAKWVTYCSGIKVKKEFWVLEQFYIISVEEMYFMIFLKFVSSKLPVKIDYQRTKVVKKLPVLQWPDIYHESRTFNFIIVLIDLDNITFRLAPKVLHQFLKSPL